jgi:hypothetical protein
MDAYLVLSISSAECEQAEAPPSFLKLHDKDGAAKSPVSFQVSLEQLTAS